MGPVPASTEEESDKSLGSLSTVLISNKTKAGPLHFVLHREDHKFLTSKWDFYRQFVRRYHLKLELLDDAIHRLLFWLPHHDSSGAATPWREILYGLLSVNQLAMYCCQQPTIQNSYGFSVSTAQEPTISATSFRIALSVIHCLMPSILEVAAKLSTNTTMPIPVASLTRCQQSSQARIRLKLEQIKFSVRLYLLYCYWRQIRRRENFQSASFDEQPGIMLNGGMYQPMEDWRHLTQHDLATIQRKLNYRGRRTGMKISKHFPRVSSYQAPYWKLICSEILYILRPLLWAMAESNESSNVREDPNGAKSSLSKDPLLRSWLLTLGMDLVSLRLLEGQRVDGNPHSREELQRRRMKLFLYLLRAPIWTEATSPALERFSKFSSRIPLLNSYLWDWCLYWRHPFFSEEG